MRYVYLFLLCLLTASLAISQSTGYVVVKGRVTYSNGTAVNNWPVNVRSDSTIFPVGCVFSHTSYTNPNGYYADTIFCSTPLLVVIVTTKDCNNYNVSHVNSVPPGVPPVTIIEDNFVICTPGTTTGCHAVFTSSVSGNQATFNASSSTGSSGSAIMSYKWVFGDGTSLTNGINPNATHFYNSAGTYAVKLIIVTTNNSCEDSVVQQVQITTGTIHCQAYFIDSVIGNSVYSNSSYSTTGTGDSIVQRRWTFGDNTPALTGNVVYPTHIYNANGTYTICLKIISARGCSDSICKAVAINNVTTTCISSFVSTRSGNAFSFNSSSSQTPAPDVIIRRKWQFGDGDTLGGNIISPTHTYAHSGAFTACLTIYTQNGCSRSYCKTLTIIDSTCHANFTFGATPVGTYISFMNTSTSGAGSVVATYLWNFGDNSTSTLANPTHQFAGHGTYNVCLTISTSTGCQSSECKQITIAGAKPCHASIQLASSALIVGAPVYLDSRGSTTVAPDSIYKRLWSFGDGTSLGGNFFIPSHTYVSAGNYNVRLIIVSTGGCRDTVFLPITIVPVPTSCHASFYDTTVNNLTYFYSGNSNTNSGDSIVERRWTFGDGTAQAGNVVNPVRQYAGNGTYTVCLRIISSKGCRDSICRIVFAGNAIPTCAALFVSYDSLNSARFYSGNSSAVGGDSIITRNWNFGDNSTLGGNVVSPYHTYTQSGTYNVCLTITTAGGCQNTYCHPIAITVIQLQCGALFKYTKLGQKSIQYNSGASLAAAGDSIVQRKWTFGDGTTLTGNVVSPVKTYSASAIYNACLRIQTARGCIRETCMNVRVGDSTGTTPDTSKRVEIISVYPNPVTTQFTALIWSRFGGVSAELAIIDIYGVKKWSSGKVLASGFSPYIILSNFLVAGPYTFRVTTLYGVRSMRFYKL